MRRNGRMIVWPAYFDLTRTRNDGRRVPKYLAIPSPKILQIREAAQKLGLHHELVLDACHPKTPWLKTGMLLVKKKEPKSKAIRKIAEQLVKIHGQTQRR